MNAVVPLLTNRSQIDQAKLPATYEAAQKAISECERIDECRDWADKAAALASYARQARDDSLRIMAVRIQARAERRAGQLLKQIAPAHGANQNIRDGAVPKVTRESAATEAGLSERQRKTALRLASISEDEFNAHVESASPPTITHLSEVGTVQSREPPADEVIARPVGVVVQPLEQFARFCASSDPVALASDVTSADLDSVRTWVGATEQWLVQFCDNLPRESW